MRTWIALLTLAAAGCTTIELPGDHAEQAREAPATPAHLAAMATPLPEVAVVGLDGTPARLDRAAGGRPALVSFWATWCDACAAEVDALNRLHDRVGERGVVLGVAIGEPRAKAAAFAREHGLRYPQLADEAMALADALGQKRLPATLVLDRQGRVVFVGGALDERALAAFRGAMAP